MNISRRYEPFQRNTECQAYKRSTRVNSKKTVLHVKRSVCKVNQDKQRKRLNSPSKNPSRVGDYILLEVNISSHLCKAIHVETHQEYACQFIEVSKYREAFTPYTLVSPHQHINEIYEVIHGKQYVYFLFEKSYGDLHSYVRSKRKLKEKEACSLFRQIVEAVKHCHSNGVVIRDLKLRKFVFKDSNRTHLKLETLDSVHVIDKRSGDTLYDKHGCPAYVSPEILESTTGYSAKRADVWSLGVIIYTMLSGRYPFHDQDPASLFLKIKSGQYTVPDNISAAARCLIHSILRKTALERLSSEELLEHPWFNLDFDAQQTSLPGRFDHKKFDQLVPDLSLATEVPMFGFARR